ncbi:hypothetical protein AM2010_1916 [Pelagerythrobacter marensis]|uniref:Uncharacterized protein n=2 Tax=Pelagerythrobacter marensis TaxID=543877 RepID=A0A0G3XC45_9SPHN|nr:hypothetical protein AM2010_1916 [Pelagerythrobacter marensis]
MTLCSENEMRNLIAKLERGDGDRDAIETYLSSHPDDPRLHFMLGSVLVEQGDAIAAHGALERAVVLAPEFHIARYQLGFFELTSGEADRALSTWGPLLRLSDENYLRKFVEGFTFLIRDEFPAAVVKLREGVALNRENEAVNDDIRLLVSQVEKLAQTHAPTNMADEGDKGDTDQSATSVLLGQFGASRTQH